MLYLGNIENAQKPDFVHTHTHTHTHTSKRCLEKNTTGHCERQRSNLKMTDWLNRVVHYLKHWAFWPLWACYQ